MRLIDRIRRNYHTEPWWVAAIFWFCGGYLFARVLEIAGL